MNNKTFKIVNGDSFGYYTQNENGLFRHTNTKRLCNWFGDMPDKIEFCLVSGFEYGSYIGGFESIYRCE